MGNGKACQPRIKIKKVKNNLLAGSKFCVPGYEFSSVQPHSTSQPTKCHFYSAAVSEREQLIEHKSLTVLFVLSYRTHDFICFPPVLCTPLFNRPLRQIWWNGSPSRPMSTQCGPLRRTLYRTRHP